MPPLLQPPLGRGLLTGKYRHSTPTESRGASPQWQGFIDGLRSDTSDRIVEAVVTAAGYPNVRVVQVLRPAWTTDWMSPEGMAKLNEYGIAPPTGRTAAGHNSGPVRLSLAVKCPRCNSLNTREMTRFGSTSCKSLWVCNDCKEPFDYFKVH